MKGKKEQSIIDYKVAVAEAKRKYVLEAMEFRRRLLATKEMGKPRDKQKKTIFGGG